MSFLLSALLLLIPQATAPSPAPAPASVPAPAASPEGYVLGQASAPHRLVEYLSYTCGHCARFATEAGPALKAGPVASGKLSLEVRHVVRDPFDYVATVLARCEGPARFFDHHQAILAAHPQWMAKAKTFAGDAAATQALATQSRADALASLARGTGLDALMIARGVTPAAQRACFADEGVDATLKAMAAASKADGVPGTPSFTLDGKLLPEVHDWAALKPALDAALAAR